MFLFSCSVSWVVWVCVCVVLHLIDKLDDCVVFVRNQIMTQRERDTIIHLIAGGWVFKFLLLLPHIFLIDFIHIHSFKPSIFPLVRLPVFWVIIIAACSNYLSFLIHSFAGTIGAIVTCPLEVVKTRLQSSSSQFYPRFSDVANKLGTNTENFKGTTPRREICTSILQKRSQVCFARKFISRELSYIAKTMQCSFHIWIYLQILTISNCGISSSSQSISIWQCLK